MLCIKPAPSHRTGFAFPLPNPSYTKGYFFLLEGKPFPFLSTNAECRFLLFPSKHWISPSGLNNIPLRSEVIALTTEVARGNFGGPSRAPRHLGRRGGAGSERRRRANPPRAAVLVCSHHGENHLFHLERGLVPHALPPHPGSLPSCRGSMSTEGMNLLR